MESVFLYVFRETIAVRYAYLFDQPLDVLIQGIQLSLNDGDQFFPEFSSMVCLPIVKLFSLYRKHKGSSSNPAGFIILPMPVRL